jgi:hypothetical protein
MTTLIKIFRLTGIMTSISLMDSEVEAIHSYIQMTLQILNHLLISTLVVNVGFRVQASCSGGVCTFIGDLGILPTVEP